MWTATPETNATWTSKILYISKDTGEVGFTNTGNSSSNIITSGFQLYDKNTILRGSDQTESLWNVQATDTENVWTLGWGSADEDDALTAVALRTVAPTRQPTVEENGE